MGWVKKSAHVSLRWRYHGRHSVSNHQPHDCLINRLFRRRSKKTSKLRVTGLCVGNSPGTGEFPAEMASNAENVSIWWRHHDTMSNPLRWPTCAFTIGVRLSMMGRTARFFGCTRANCRASLRASRGRSRAVRAPHLRKRLFSSSSIMARAAGRKGYKVVIELSSIVILCIYLYHPCIIQWETSLSYPSLDGLAQDCTVREILWSCIKLSCWSDIQHEWMERAFRPFRKPVITFL